MSVGRPRRKFRWQRAAILTFTWVLLTIFVLTSVGVALVTFSAR